MLQVEMMDRAHRPFRRGGNSGTLGGVQRN